MGRPADAPRVKGLVSTIGIVLAGIAIAMSGTAAAAGLGPGPAPPAADGTPGMCPQDTFPYCRAVYYSCLVLVDVAGAQAVGPLCAFI